MLQHKCQLFTFSNDKLFLHELKILNYIGLWENKKTSDYSALRLDEISFNIGSFADIDLLDDLTF